MHTRNREETTSSYLARWCNRVARRFDEPPKPCTYVRRNLHRNSVSRQRIDGRSTYVINRWAENVILARVIRSTFCKGIARFVDGKEATERGLLAFGTKLFEDKNLDTLRYFFYGERKNRPSIFVRVNAYSAGQRTWNAKEDELVQIEDGTRATRMERPNN